MQVLELALALVLEPALVPEPEPEPVLERLWSFHSLELELVLVLEQLWSFHSLELGPVLEEQELAALEPVLEPVLVVLEPVPVVLEPVPVASELAPAPEPEALESELQGTTYLHIHQCTGLRRRCSVHQHDSSELFRMRNHPNSNSPFLLRVLWLCGHLSRWHSHHSALSPRCAHLHLQGLQG